MTATRTLSASLQQLGRTLAARDLSTLTDAELVRRFANRRDEAAFTALVFRHGSMVLGVCRRLLRHEQDAEDAFQAAFLVLARKAGQVSQAGAVGNWLYGVAVNVARKARAQRLVRDHKEQQAAARTPTETAPVAPDDLREILDGELAALPDRYRAPIVLCDLRGLTLREAAAQVGCPEKTLGTRLTRGRSRLAQRLSRRGVTLSAATLTAALAPHATATPPGPLVSTTIHTVLAATSGSATAVTPTIVALSEGVTRIMVPKSLKTLALFGGLVLIFGGLAAHAHHRPPTPQATLSDTSDAAPMPSTPPPATLHSRLRGLHDYLISLIAPTASLFVEIAHFASDDRPALKGTWTRKDADLKLEFVNKETLKLQAHNGALTVVCTYTRGKDDRLKAKISSLEGTEELKAKAKDILNVGKEFDFLWKATATSATLEDLKGEKTEVLKNHLEGEYNP